ncbi:MAG: hypothetical protein A2086_10960 [Spirochaetes bacterium GWD1_27_9]|nr:MAG: hypothetical protein A2Z98_00070 [Spirochaetes bacterium GWB1_27_13]OHD20179.1 MAG: hypothetical protein A2Y34_05080 [Spirochaetes bacterium GWC1_27_15]OHD41271.1 MAG: hypothetical protein A2086_10960 [Spirochaetes bacterium GWD1_27_9]
MTMLYMTPLIIMFFIIMQAFFSNSEMAMVSANKIKLSHLANKGNKRASIILALLNKPERLFGTTLVGINFATVIATALSDYYFHDIVAKYYPQIEKFISLELLTFLIMEPAILIFGELFPMSLARKYPNTTSLRNSWLIRLAYFVFFPFMYIVSNISKFIGLLFKSSANEFGKISRDELQLLVAGKFSHITDDTKKIIEDVFDINELKAEDIMIHLNEVKSISEDSTVGDLKELIRATKYSRFPVYSENVFNIVATIHAVNILGADDKDLISQHTEKLYIVPSSKPIVQILSDLKRNRKYMGIVVDEYGAVCGILAIENIAEELIGKIRNDLDPIEKPKINEDDNIFEARTYLDEFYEQTGIDFTDEDVETLGGIINLALGRIAKKNDRVFYRDIEFEVIEASDRAVKKVKLITKK